jgi:hypothetical protein
LLSRQSLGDKSITDLNMYGSVQPRFHCWLFEPNETLAVTSWLF